MARAHRPLRPQPLGLARLTTTGAPAFPDSPSPGGPARLFTVDIDCLRSGEAVTNWESGLFTAGDIAWPLDELHAVTEVIGGDLCGAWSPPRHARFKQWLSSRLDHPRQPRVDLAHAARANERAFHIIWPSLTAGDEQYAGADQRYAHP